MTNIKNILVHSFLVIHLHNSFIMCNEFKDDINIEQSFIFLNTDDDHNLDVIEPLDDISDIFTKIEDEKKFQDESLLLSENNLPVEEIAALLDDDIELVPHELINSVKKANKAKQKLEKKERKISKKNKKNN